MIILSIIFFSIFDYLGYNISRIKKWVNDEFINPYRIVQVSIQLLMYASLWYFFGFFVALGSLIAWLTWLCDLGYYVLEYVFLWEFSRAYPSIPKNILRKKVFKSIDDGQISWAFFTFIGIWYWIKTGNRNTCLSDKQIWYQAVVGLGIVIALTLA